ncbi:Probable ubiquitin conjugation factor E4 [Linum perenne]
MATPKPQSSPVEIEHIILRQILLVSLSDAPDPTFVYLEKTAAEILSERKDLKLSRDLLQRVLIARLSGDFPASEAPFPYLLGCFRRAVYESKKIANMKDDIVKSQLETTINQAKKLLVSYVRLHLGDPYMFPSNSPYPDLSLLPLILGAVGGSQPPPPGFLDELFAEEDFDSLDPIFTSLYHALRGNVIKVSALGNFQQSLAALLYLVKMPAGAKSLVNNHWWIPRGAYMNGRAFEMTSVLGAFFHVSALPDYHPMFKSEPDVGLQCFSAASTCKPADLLSSFTTIKTAMNNLHEGLSDVLLTLVVNADTRERVLQYLAEVININASRAHIQVDPMSCSSSGMLVNLSAVMLRLCEPFLDANCSKVDEIDPGYVFYSDRLNLRGLTALHASSEEVAEWIRNNNPLKSDIDSGFRDIVNRLIQSQGASSSGTGTAGSKSALSGGGEKASYTFICECFFMTARVLNLGLLKAFSDFKHLVQDISRYENALSRLKTMEEQTPSPQMQLEINLLEKELELCSQEKLCYEAQLLRDPTLIQKGLSFYRLMVVWLVKLAGGFKMPLSSTCPMEFASMPDHFVEDAMELLIFASRIPKALDGVILDDFINFIIMFMGSPTHIRSPYLRAKMVEVLNCWMPHGR